MLRLYDWYLESGLAWGIVEGHDKLDDGLFIHTSPLMKADLNEAEGYLELLTFSNNVYRLYWKDIRLDAIKYVKKELKQMGVSTRFLSKCKDLQAESRKELYAKADSILSNNELLFITLQKVAVYKNKDGNIIDLSVDCHVGMFQDSILVRDLKSSEVDFRYFPKGIFEDRIVPYHWSDGLKRIAILNNTRLEMFFEGTDKDINCPSGNLTWVTSDDYRGEGLFSPDVVNGKCLLS